MKQKIIFLILFSICAVTVQAQKKSSKTKKGSKQTAVTYSKTASGLEYRIIKDSAGTNYPEVGGFFSFWFQLKTEKDSILENQFKEARPVGVSTPAVTHKPSMEEGFLLLTEGDSAIFLLNADTLYLQTFQQPLPPHIASGSKMKVIIKMDKVYSKHFVDSVTTAYAAQQAAQEAASAVNEAQVYSRDSALIQQYLATHKLKGEATPGGAYVVKLKSNTTESRFIQSGESIDASYIGTLLDGGMEFDRSPAGEYFTFVVGQQQVIGGWDEGFLKLKHGEKALILIPSRLAYGSRGAGGVIPPDAPLLFEVEVK